MRLNLDMLRTRSREDVLLHACLAAQQPFVVDNTNPTAGQRSRYAAIARASGFRVVGYYFDVGLGECLRRNAARPEARRVPDIGLRGTFAKLTPPTLAEGFDELYRVTTGPGGGDDFTVETLS